MFNDVSLTIPHKEILKRDFVIKPLLDLLGSFTLPGTNTIIDKALLSNLENHIIGEIEIELLNLTTTY